MGQYKVPQNVETEDKLVGSFTLRQLIYMAIAIGWGFLIYRIFKSNIPIMIVLMLPISGFFFVLGVARKEEQSFESYLAAVLRFYFVDKKRVWNKELSADINTGAIQDPSLKDDEVQLNTVPTKGQLKQIANILDTRERFEETSQGPNIPLTRDDANATRIVN